jgi:hypothetical protein
MEGRSKVVVTGNGKMLEPVKAGKQPPQPDLLDADVSDGQSTAMVPAISPNREREEPD